MVEIIEKGTKNRATCDFCGCLFSYDKEDIEETQQHIDQFRTYSQKYVKCPQCNTNVIIWSER